MAETYYPRSISGYNSLLLLPRGFKDTANGASGLRGVIVQHGHGGNCAQMGQGSAFGDHPDNLANQGFAVIGIDEGPTSWFDTAAMTAVTAAYNSLMSLGCVGTKVGLMGWSMGGGTVLNWLKQNPTKVACCWVWDPALDLDWLSSKSGYTPPYSTDGDTASASWGTEINSDYPSGYTSSNPMANTASFRGVCPIMVSHVTTDPVLPYDSAAYWISQVNDPKVTMRSPAVTTGGHQGAILNVPPSETATFFHEQWQS